MSTDAKTVGTAKTLSAIDAARKQINVLDELNGKIEQQIQSLIEQGAVVEENAEASNKVAEKEKNTAKEKENRLEIPFNF